MVFALKHLLSLLIKSKIIAASARHTMVLLLTPSGFTSVSIVDLGYLHSRTSSCTGPALLIGIFDLFGVCDCSQKQNHDWCSHGWCSRTKTMAAAAMVLLVLQQNHGFASALLFLIMPNLPNGSMVAPAMVLLLLQQPWFCWFCSYITIDVCLFLPQTYPAILERQRPNQTSIVHSVKFEQEIEFGGGCVKHLSGFANQNKNMRPDRLWMYNCRDQSRKGLNCAFIDGVEEFVSFVLSQPNFVSNRQIRCHCSRCDNTKFFDVEIVKVHLYSRGFIPNYDQWSFHGEPLHYSEECEIGSAMEERVEAENEEMVDGDHVERVDVNLADPYRTMILEAAGPSFNPNTNVEFYEPPNQDAKKFYDLLKATEKPLYEGCSRHTPL
ncbi:uncharacterized protein G2W53_021828 [Senna tora]|uniref:Transposase-associated domain-containing protein n=1 Tax=Senna tora TaxID=362788 RepID=A0A834WNQ5_9FABA|nr:uncharacterized protein G2W53_021828 [Senna tora]